MISLVLGATLLAAAPGGATPPEAAWTPHARCAAALSVEAQRPASRPAPGAANPLPIEALITMNRAAGAARAEGLSRDVVERQVAALKVEYRRVDADDPGRFQILVRGCRIARGAEAREAT